MFFSRQPASLVLFCRRKKELVQAHEMGDESVVFPQKITSYPLEKTLPT